MMIRILMFAVPLFLALYALIDCAMDNDVERTSFPKPLWIIVILIPVIGPVAWIIAAKIMVPPGQTRLKRSTGPLAPDDDPEFLRQLDAELGREQKENPEGEDPDNEGKQGPSDK